MHYEKNVFAVHPALCHALLVFVVHRPKRMVLTVYFGAPSMFITLWFGFDY
jgi:hypothetical protein